MKSRMAAGANQPAKRGTKTLHEWNNLMRKVILRAEAIGDERRLRQLRQALQQGESAECLKRMSIISETDIDRELSDPKK